MRPRALLVVLTLVAGIGGAAGQSWSDMTLWYGQPAERWEEALPVGNGRLGAMVYGRTGTERIALNEETLWTGGPYDPTREGGAEALHEIRRLLFEGDVERAHDLFGRTMMGIPYEQQKYQPLGTLLLEFPGHDEAVDYRRELDMDAAEARVSYTVDGVRYTRTVFSSAPDQVIVVRLEASRPGALTLDARLFGARNTAHSNYDTAYFLMDGLEPDTLRLTGKNSDYLGVEGTLTYEARVLARAQGGTVSVDYRTLRVVGADAVTLVIGAATSFEDWQNTSADPAARVAAVVGSAPPYEKLRERHVNEHRGWFRRVSLDLEGPDRSAVATDVRLPEAATDPDLAELAYQFGRYLLIASSRPGTQAANLQGIWNESPNPSWDSKYTININIPMNYWPAETAGLPELAIPLYDMVQDVSEAGRSVAQAHWGARGWVLHQNTDLWRATAPMDGPSWGAWPVGGAWLATHLIERDRFSPDAEFLEAWYPVVRDQALFLSDILVEHPEHGWLVTAPSNSPENFPAYPGNGRYFDETSGLFLRGRMMQPGPTMDNHIVRALFDGFLDWSTRMDADPDLRERIAVQRDRLPPNQIGRHGQLQEWIEDWDELEPEHRHVSHVWGVYPGNEILADTPTGAAASISLDRRGTGGCGWSYSHKAAARARLHEADQAFDQLTSYLSGNVLPNLFSRCGSTLQVDGSFGMTAAIGEMLLQSDTGVIELLPALPAAWGSGSVSGLRARGGFTVDFRWSGGDVVAVTLGASEDGVARLDGLSVVSVTENGVSVSFQAEGRGVEFQTRAGSTYLIQTR